MNHRFAAAAATVMAALGGPAGAQSSVTMYGIVDAGVEYQRTSAGSAGPAKTSKQLVSGTYSASRVGFRGTEDLGDGLRAFFQLGFNVNDGTVTGTGLFGRKSVVGLGGAWGEIWFGRDYTPAFWVQYYSDVNSFALYGNSGTMSAFALTDIAKEMVMSDAITPCPAMLKGRSISMPWGTLIATATT